MTNEKRELFATLGLIAEESVANESVNTELEPEVELTALESIESELKDLDEIEKSFDEAEKASFESMVSDLELLNSVLAYKSVKTAGAEEAALESISAEFGISTEGIKDLAEKGVKSAKAVIKKIIALIKGLFGAEQTTKKVLKQLTYKSTQAGMNNPAEIEVSNEEYQEYVQLFIHSYMVLTQYKIDTNELLRPQGVNVPSDIAPILEKFVQKFTDEATEWRTKAESYANSDMATQAKFIIEAINYNNIFLKDPSSKPIDGLKELTVPSGFKMGPALVDLVKILSKDTNDKIWRDVMKALEADTPEDAIQQDLYKALMSCVTNARKFKQNVIRKLTMMMGKYIPRYNKANKKAA